MISKEEAIKLLGKQKATLAATENTTNQEAVSHEKLIEE